jgi:MerR family transcriptional regulator, thiopeptide resistance regulator
MEREAMKQYTVNEVAKLSGVSVRTLHHYDEIGLLKPAFIGENRYRYYGPQELLRLQQILFHREFGIPLSEIAALIDQPGLDRVAVLKAHKTRLEQEAKRYRQLIETIDRTIARLNGETKMQDAELYKGFSPEKQAEYEKWLIARYGADMEARIAQGKAKLGKMSDAERAQAMTALADLEHGLAEGLRRGLPANSDSLDPLLSGHRAWVALMWGRECSSEAYAGLADLYLAHPDFRTRYETIEPGFCDYLTTAMKAYAARQPA